MTDDATMKDERIGKAMAGDEAALADLFDQYSERLKRMVMLRMDRRVQGRLDASDVLQDAYVDLAQRLPEYAKDPKIPFFLWLRLVTGQRLALTHRNHLGAEMRDANRDVSLYRGRIPQASTFFLASRLVGKFTSVDRQAIRAETQLKLQEVLNAMDPTDREILALRHFEELSTSETATVLGITKSGVLKRHTRALTRLGEAIQEMPGLSSEIDANSTEDRESK